MTTLCYIERDDAFLMLHRTKKKNDINEDKWIGVGGHFETGEGPEDCLLREVYEETGLALNSYSFRGFVTFISDVWPTEIMCLYTSDDFDGEIKDCDEGELLWVQKNELMKLHLWEGDKIFLKLLMDDAPVFTLKLVYQGDELVEAQLNGQHIK